MLYILIWVSEYPLSVDSSTVVVYIEDIENIYMIQRYRDT